MDIDGRSARQYASQGQTRTAALSLKLAQRDIIFDDREEYPVLLLDDVLELDPGGRNSCSTTSRADRCSSPAARRSALPLCGRVGCSA